MCNQLIKDSQHPQSGFYLNNLKDLSEILSQNCDSKTLLIGVSYALLDLAEQFLTLEKYYSNGNRRHER